MSRHLDLVIEPITGTHNFFVAKVNDEVVLYGPAGRMKFEADIPDRLTKIFVSSLGVGSGPTYKVSIDLPGNANDHSNTYILDRGYHEITYIL